MIQHVNPDQDGAPAASRNRIPPQAMANVQPTRSPRREVQVGIFVLIGILSVVAALFILTDPGTFRGRYHVSTVLNDAGGIRLRDPVQQNGVNIGRVMDLKLNGDGAVVMQMEIEGKYTFPADSRVQLAAKGLLGEIVAEIHPGTSSKPAADGDVLASGAGQNGLAGQAQQLGDKADTLLTSANRMLSPQTIGSVQTSAVELQTMLASLQAMAAEQRAELNSLTASLNRSAKGVEATTTRPELARAIARTDSISARLDAATRSLNQSTASMAVVMGRLERGEGTMGKLMTDDSLYVNLNSAVANLNQLTTDIRANPKKYLSVSVF
jgi:phospholipid/cholesterol/gamma-HCH transport system substrate-binding protein